MIIYIVIEWWLSDNDNYWVIDDVGKWYVVCIWLDFVEWEKCYVFGFVSVVRYLNCKF